MINKSSGIDNPFNHAFIRVSNWSIEENNAER